MSNLLYQRLADLRCPDCTGTLLRNDQSMSCTGCGRDFAHQAGAFDLTPAATSEEKARIASFWGDVYQQWYATADASYTPETLRAALTELTDLFRRREHLAVVEMGQLDLLGKDLLEIGSGAGGHSAFLRSRGARVISVDITPARVFATARKLYLLSDEPGAGAAARADAENLPFADNTFDVVFSNGVLHHTTNTERAIAEVRRVLRPGGRAVLMLYSRHSAYYWTVLFPLAVLSGRFFTQPEGHWLGYFTEGRPTFTDQRNPITRVYSKRQLHQLMSAFRDVKVRKTSFNLTNLPIPRGGAIRDWLLTKLGHKAHPGATIVYGSPRILESDLERHLGHHIGFAWNVVASK